MKAADEEEMREWIANFIDHEGEDRGMPIPDDWEQIHSCIALTIEWLRSRSLMRPIGEME